MTGPGRGRWIALGVVAALLVAGLSVGLVVALTRPPEVVAATPAPASTATPQPAPTAAAAPADDARQHQQYRAYVSTLVRGGTAVLAGIGGLAGCRVSRAECTDRLGQASEQVAALRRDLAASAPPACLATADERLQDALSFQQNGLDAARQAVRSENRVQLVQGLLLTGVGLWRAGQAIAAGRQSSC